MTAVFDNASVHFLDDALVSVTTFAVADGAWLAGGSCGADLFAQLDSAGSGIIWQTLPWPAASRQWSFSTIHAF